MMQDSKKKSDFCSWNIFLSSYKAAHIIKMQNELQQQLPLKINEYNQ